MKNLSQKVVELLKKRRLKISLAESCTGGLLSSSITSINGSSRVFEIGLVTYSNKSKINTLKVPKKTIMKYGAVSIETCLSMVKNLNKISKTNISVSITGIAGPKGKTKKKPVDQSSAKYKEIKKKLKNYQKFVKQNFEFVGDNFTYEARSIHYNNKKGKKGIYGNASLKDVKELKEEGIETEMILWIDDKEN